jgi:hypothetical protein
VTGEYSGDLSSIDQWNETNSSKQNKNLSAQSIAAYMYKVSLLFDAVSTIHSAAMDGDLITTNLTSAIGWEDTFMEHISIL